MAAVLPADTGKLGPGVLKIGATGSEIDVSCYVNGAKIAPSKDTGDATTKLCGTIRPGAISYTYQLTGNIDVDAGNDSGLFALSYSAAGTPLAFTFTPSTLMGTTATGTLVLDPLTFGADKFGDDLTSDIALDLVGAPEFTYA